MIARASGSLKPIRCNVSSHLSSAIVCTGLHTGQVEEVGILVELVEDGTRAVLDVGGCEHGNGAFGEGIGELHSPVVVFLGGDSGRDCSAS